MVAGDHLSCWQVGQVLFVLVADEFENVGAERQMHLLCGCSPWPGVGLRVIDGGLQLEMPKIDSAKAFGYMKSLCSRMSFLCVEPGPVIEAGRLDADCVSIRLSCPVT